MAHYYYKIKDKIKHNNKDIICCNLGYYEFNYKTIDVFYSTDNKVLKAGCSGSSRCLEEAIDAVKLYLKVTGFYKFDYEEKMDEKIEMICNKLIGRTLDTYCFKVPVTKYKRPDKIVISVCTNYKKMDALQEEVLKSILEEAV